MGHDLEPPVLLESARVVLFAETGGRASYTGRRMVIVGDKPLDPVPRLAICEDLVESAFLLMHCEVAWNVLTVGFFSTIEAAKSTAEEAYAGISAKWLERRKLTDRELFEVEELRRSLRTLAAAHPIDRDPPCCLTRRSTGRAGTCPLLGRRPRGAPVTWVVRHSEA